MEDALALVRLGLEDIDPEVIGWSDDDYHFSCGHFHVQGSPCPVDVQDGCGDYRCCINY